MPSLTKKMLELTRDLLGQPTDALCHTKHQMETRIRMLQWIEQELRKREKKKWRKGHPDVSI